MPNRMEALAALVPAELKSVVDVGYDHGDLMVRLLDERAELRCIGVEVQPSSANSFWTRHAARAGQLSGRVDLRRGDGLHPLKQGEAQLAVVAGMGDKKILTILREGMGKLAAPSLWLLAPMAMEAELRPAFRELGLMPLDEQLVLDAGRFHELILVGPGEWQPQDELELRFGRRHFERDEPLLPAYLEDLNARHCGAMERLRAGESLATSEPRSSKLMLLDRARERAAGS